jgi:hypothetical protein
MTVELPTDQYTHVLQILIEKYDNNASDATEIQQIIAFLRARFASEARVMIRESPVEHPSITQPGGSKIFDGKTLQLAGACRTSSNSYESNNKIKNLQLAFSTQLQHEMNLASLDSMHM